MQNKITGKMRKALPLLVSGMAGKDVAASVGVQESTVSHWINHHPQFAIELDRLRQQASNQAIAQLSSSVALAAETIRQILITGKTEAAKLRAAEFIINNFGLSLRSNTKQADTSTPEIGGKVNMDLVLQGLGISHAR
jgi:hypothetical protein